VVLQPLIEKAAIGQAGERIVQRIVLDAGTGRLKLGIAGLAQAIGEPQIFVEGSIGRHIPVDAEHAAAAPRARRIRRRWREYGG